jgi:hypothetical protein
MSYSSWWYNVLHKITGVFSRTSWRSFRALFNHGIYYDLKEEDLDKVRKYLSKSYFIILTYRKAHLTTWLVGLLTLIKTGKWPKYSHVLMNVDSENDKDNWNCFKLIEASNKGVHYSTFMEVFDCDAVCLLQPKNISQEELNYIIDGLLTQHGYKYDDLFDLSDQTHVSCVELVLNALKKTPNYATDFAELDKMINKVGNLTPQMYLDCPDFKKILEIRR